eukprot:gene7703-12169_t
MLFNSAADLNDTNTLKDGDEIRARMMRMKSMRSSARKSSENYSTTVPSTPESSPRKKSQEKLSQINSMRIYKNKDTTTPKSPKSPTQMSYQDDTKPYFRRYVLEDLEEYSMPKKPVQQISPRKTKESFLKRRISITSK